MNWKLFVFELNYYRKQLVFWLALLYAIFAGSLLLTNAPESIYFANSPYSIINALLQFTAMATVFICGFLAASSLLRDSNNDFESLIFTTAIDKFTYLWIKFSGLFTAVLLVHSFLMIVMAVSINSLDADRVTDFNLTHYMFGLFVIFIPNILICVSIIFATAMLTKKIMPIYIVSLALFIIYIAASMLGNSPIMAMSSPFTQEGAGISSFLDPYAIIAFFEQSSFWSAEEKNTLLPSLEGKFLYNRMIWITISLSILAITYKRFSFKVKNKKINSDVNSEHFADVKVSYKTVQSSDVYHKFSVKAFLSKLYIEYLTVIKGLPFIIIMALIVTLNLITLGEQISRGPLDQISYYPLTELILELLQDPLSKIGLFISIFYAVELYWNERSHRIFEIIDSSPVRNTLFYLSKLSTHILIIFTIIFISIISAILFQFSLGHFDVKALLYFRLFYYSGALLILIGAFTFFIQKFAPNKAAGLALGAIVLIYPNIFSYFEIAHPMTIFAYAPKFIFSDMANSVFHEEAYDWINLYWFSFTALLALVSIKYWKRGFSKRKEHFSKISKVFALGFLILFILSGSYNYYQYNIKNMFNTRDERIAYKAYYEKNYSKYEDLNQPTFTSIDISVDVFPEARAYAAKGKMYYKNKSSEAIDKLMISLQQVNQLDYELQLDNAKLDSKNEEDLVFFYSLNSPLLPGDSSSLDFSIKITRTAFSRLDGENYVTAGGSYFELEDYLPFFGYLDTYELNNKTLREENNLPESSYDNPAGKESLFTDDWIYYTAKISTDEDQYIVTVGNLEKEEHQNGRRYFYYKTDQKIERVFPVMSANYAKHQENYNGVELSIYHDPDHDKDTPLLVDAFKVTLDYFQENFAAYSFKNFKIAELPYFSSEQSFGAAFPGMYAGVENRFFNLNHENSIRNENLRGVTHEFSHQYWGMLISPRGIGGYSMLTEVLAKYSELVVHEKVYGKYSNNASLNQALDIYLRNRTRSDNAEKPLSTIDMNPTVYYMKGLHSMTALHALIGEENVNLALRNLIAKYRHPVRPTSLHLLAEYYAVADSTAHPIIRDLFERIVFHDFKIKAVSVKSLESGYETSISIEALKFVVNEETNSEFEESINDSIEVAFYSSYPEIENQNMIHIEKVKLDKKMNQIIIRSKEKAKYIKVDPNNYRIDRSTADNMIKVE